jgi:hypothetical protein
MKQVDFFVWQDGRVVNSPAIDHSQRRQAENDAVSWPVVGRDWHNAMMTMTINHHVS